MKNGFLKFSRYLADAFWVAPALLVVALGALAQAAVHVQAGRPDLGWLPAGLIYGGGETGARALLSAIAASSIGVAGTIFSVTLAALTLASNQLGPRLLRNFTQDRGNQLTLGVFLGTFAFALVALRSTRAGDEPFVPALAVTIALALAAWCVGMLVYFVHHIASRINVDTVIALVHRDISREIRKLGAQDAPSGEPEAFVDDGSPVRAVEGGYLLNVDVESLTAWAARQSVRIQLAPRKGDFIFPGAVVAWVRPECDGAEEAVRDALALTAQRQPGDDLSYALQQLSALAARALSPGINDPLTAIAVVERLGAALCELADHPLPPQSESRDGEGLLLTPEKSYVHLTEEAFGLIIDCAGRAPSVLLKLLQTLAAVVTVETRDERRRVLRALADRTLAVAEGPSEAQHAALRAAHAAFLRAAAA